MDVEQVLLRFRATTSAQDQDDLLRLAKEDKTKHLCGPLVLGKRQRDEEEKRLVDTVSTEDVFNPWSKFLIQSSIANFPTSLKLRAKKHHRSDSEDVGAILDPRFVLAQFWHLLSARNLINCQLFVDRDGLSYTLVALSSRKACIRKLAYSTLQRFYRQLESMTFSTFKDRQLWLNFLDMLRCCLTDENQQLRRLRTSFYTNSICVLRDPLHPLFGDIRQLLLNHSADDVELANELMKILRSSHPKSHKAAFEWASGVMVQGIDQQEDFDLLDKCLAFDLLIELGSSPLLSAEERLVVLFVLEEATKIDEAVKSLCHKNALIAFLNEQAFEAEMEEMTVVAVVKIACNAAKFCCSTSNSSDTLQSDVCQLLLSLSRHVTKFGSDRKTLASDYLNWTSETIAEVSKRRGSSDWLLLCGDDLKHIRSIKQQVPETVAS